MVFEEIWYSASVIINSCNCCIYIIIKNIDICICRGSNEINIYTSFCWSHYVKFLYKEECNSAIENICLGKFLFKNRSDLSKQLLNKTCPESFCCNHMIKVLYVIFSWSISFISFFCLFFFLSFDLHRSFLSNIEILSLDSHRRGRIQLHIWLILLCTHNIRLLIW